MLNLERLRVLHSIATYGSVTAAADVLHVTTSAISQQMARLERETGQRLLTRHGRGVRLTDAGALLAEHADQLLMQVRRAQAELEAHSGNVASTLTMAAFATAARGLATPALAELRVRHPDLAISLDEAEPHEALPLVARGDLDLAIVQDWSSANLTVPTNLSRQTLAYDTVDVAVPAGDPCTEQWFADRTEVALTDLADQPWITWKRGWVCNEWLDRTFREHGIEPRITHTAAEHHTQLSLVAAGLGVAVIPRLGRDPVPAGVRFVEVRPTLTRRIYAVWRTDAHRRPAIRATVQALRHAADHHVPTSDSPERMG